MTILKLKKTNLTAIRIFSKDVDIEKVLVSNKIYFGEKDTTTLLVTCNDDHRVKPLHIMLPKTNAFVESHDGPATWMYFLIENYDLLKKYNAI